MAKLIIKLINNASDVVNNDKDIGDLLKVGLFHGLLSSLTVCRFISFQGTAFRSPR